jgi:hypothetical protein
VIRRPAKSYEEGEFSAEKMPLHSGRTAIPIDGVGRSIAFKRVMPTLFTSINLPPFFPRVSSTDISDAHASATSACLAMGDLPSCSIARGSRWRARSKHRPCDRSAGARGSHGRRVAVAPAEPDHPAGR